MGLSKDYCDTVAASKHQAEKVPKSSEYRNTNVSFVVCRRQLFIIVLAADEWGELDVNLSSSKIKGIYQLMAIKKPWDGQKKFAG